MLLIFTAAWFHEVNMSSTSTFKTAADDVHFNVLISAVRIRANVIFHLTTSCFGLSTFLLEAYCTDYKFLPERSGTYDSVLFVTMAAT